MNTLFYLNVVLSRMALSVILHVDVGDGQSKESRGVSPATRAMRRGNRRLTRNESRYHSGKSLWQYCTLISCTIHF